MSGKTSIEEITTKILEIRGRRVLLDRDLARLYGVSTKVLNQALRRHMDRFPADFMYQLTKEEFMNLRSQFVTSNWGGRRYPPYVFTQEGVAMLSGVINSKKAVQINIQIMRAFVMLREFLSTHKELAIKLKELERKIGQHDHEIQDIFAAIRQLTAIPEKHKRKIGFHTD